MRIKILTIILICIFLSSISWADEYVQVMSKDNNVCQHMLKIYKDDLKKYGEIRYDQHEEFNVVKWEDRKYLFSPDGKTKIDTPVFLSRFDINNDGSPEIIVLDKKRRLSGVDSDGLYIFRDKTIDYDEDNIVIDENFANNAIGAWGGVFNRKPFRGNTYYLKGILQKQKKSLHGDEKKNIYHSLGGWFYFNPFYYDGIYYVAMTDWQPHQLDTEKWLVILKLNPDNQIKDVCYFQKRSKKS